MRSSISNSKDRLQQTPPSIPQSITVCLSDGTDPGVPTTLLIEKSKYFQRGLSSTWQEPFDGTTRLDFNMAPWRSFRLWLETDNVCSGRCWMETQTPGSELQRHSPADDGEPLCHHYLSTRNGRKDSSSCLSSINRLTQAWILGDYLLATLFQNAVVDELTCALERFWDYTDHVPWEYMRYVYENTVWRSPLRQVVFDLVQFGVSRKIVSINEETRSFFDDQGFVVGLPLAGVAERVNGGRAPAPWERPREFYHVKGCDKA